MTLDKSVILYKPQLLNCKMENYTGPAFLTGRLYRANKTRNEKEL